MDEEMKVNRWFVGKADRTGRRSVSERYELQPWLYSPEVHANGVAGGICHPWTAKSYIDRINTFDPLDIHADYLVWDGAK